MSLNNKTSGFSLVEFIIAIGVSAVVLLFSWNVLIEQQQLFINFNQNSFQQNPQVLTANLGKVFEGAGGLGLMPWQAVAVENNCSSRWVFPDCQGSDRLTLIVPKLKIDNSTYKTYSVLNYDSGTGNINIEFTAVTSPPPASVVTYTCSLNELNGQVVALFDTANNVVIVQVLGFNNASCSLRSALHKQSSVLTTSTTTSLAASTLTVVRPITYYFDRTQKKLYKFIDQNNDDTMDAGEVIEVYSNVFDFQLALGYDFSPRDGAVTDNANNTDEFLYNSPGEAWGAGFFATAQNSDLRMIQIAIAVGYPTTGGASGSFSLLDGPLINPGRFSIKKGSQNVIFRNLTTF